jgi:hypothetical protein
MIRNRKTLEEQLAEARAKKEQAAARLDQLEARRKARDARMRAWGEKVLVGVVLEAAASRTDLKDTLEDLIANADLNPKERNAALWLVASLEVPIAPDTHTAAVEPSRSSVPGQAG